jgi:hypothetical protein
MFEVRAEGPPEENESDGMVLPPHPLAQADRISWNLRFYYEQEGEDPVELYAAGWDLTNSKIVEPYQRTVTLNPGRRYNFDIGHVEEPGMIFIQNVTKWRGQLTPNEDQLKAIADSIVIVRLGDEVTGHLRPHQMQHFIGIDPLRISLECQNPNSVRLKLATFSR